MPAAAKTPFSSKNPATIAKTVGAGSFAGNAGVQQGGEVICPLFNSDGSQCRKKCVGNFAYRSICEHIRRAHPDNWIPKLPASPETFAKMVGLNPRGANGALHHHSHNIVRKPTMPSSVRKPSKLAKHENEHYIDTLSPPSSANDSDSLPPIASIHAQSHQAFQPRYPATAHYGGVMYEREEDDEDLEVDHEDDDMMRQHTETETEDEDYNSYGLHGMQYNPYMPHMQQRPRQSRPKSQKRKRQSTFDSTSSSSSFSSGSRWHELVEAATTRAVVESTPLLLSPPQTANTLPTNCPNTPTSSTTSSTHDGCSPKIQCAECNSCAPLHQSYICTECVAGFCEECALTAGKRGVCSECRVFNAKFKPLKIVIRA